MITMTKYSSTLKHLSTYLYFLKKSLKQLVLLNLTASFALRFFSSELGLFFRIKSVLLEIVVAELAFVWEVVLCVVTDISTETMP